MWRVFKVQEAFQRKLIRGIDSTAAEGADRRIRYLTKNFIDELGAVGATKDWCTQIRKDLRQAKIYFRTTYRDHHRVNGSENGESTGT
jgi:hypothetical protein